ncbi:hypothetical protein ACFFRR_011769 [Megaselia abdita]
MKHLLVLIALVVSSHQEAPYNSYLPPPTSYLPPSSGCLGCHQGGQRIDYPPQITQVKTIQSSSIPTYTAPALPIQTISQPILQPSSSYGAPNIGQPINYVNDNIYKKNIVSTYSAPSHIQNVVQPLPTYTAPNQIIRQPLPTYSAPSQTIVRPISTYGAPSPTSYQGGIDNGQRNVNYIQKNSFIKEHHYIQPSTSYGTPNIGSNIGISDLSIGTSIGTSDFDPATGYNYRRP